MAFIDCEGFDLIGSAVEPGNTPGYSTLAAQQAGVFSYGYSFGGNGVNISGAIPGNYTTLFANFHWNPRSTGDMQIIGFRDGGTAQISIGQSGSKIRVYRGTTAGTVLGTGTTTLAALSWYFIQVKLVISSTVGVVIVKIQGVEEINLTGQNTQNTANNYINQWVFGSSAFSQSYIDNLVFYDDTGASMNDFTPETRVFGQHPIGAGALTEWTPSAGSNYENVNEAYDADTTYNSAATAGLRDLYAYDSPVPAGTAVYAVKASATWRKDDIGDNECSILVRSDGTNYEDPSGPNYSLGSYLYREWRMNTDPATGNPWSVSAANAVQTGLIRKT